MIDTPTTTEDEARADLETKVREMFEPLLQVAINKLGTTPGVVQDHLQCGCDNVVPKAYLAAFSSYLCDRFALHTPKAQDLSSQYLFFM